MAFTNGCRILGPTAAVKPEHSWAAPFYALGHQPRPRALSSLTGAARCGRVGAAIFTNENTCVLDKASLMMLVLPLRALGAAGKFVRIGPQGARCVTP